MSGWTIKECLKGLEAKFDSRAGLAAELGINQDTITYWHRKGAIPSEYIIKLQRLSEGKFTYEELLGVNDDKSN